MCAGQNSLHVVPPSVVDCAGSYCLAVIEDVGGHDEADGVAASPSCCSVVRPTNPHRSRVETSLQPDPMAMSVSYHSVIKASIRLTDVPGPDVATKAAGAKGRPDTARVRLPASRPS